MRKAWAGSPRIHSLHPRRPALLCVAAILALQESSIVTGQTDAPPSAPAGLEARAEASAGSGDGFDVAGPVPLAVHDPRWKGPASFGTGAYPVSGFQVLNGQVQAVAGKSAGAYFDDGQPADQESQVIDRAHSSAIKHAAVRMGPAHLGYSIFLGGLSGGSYTRAYYQKDGRYAGTAGIGSWSASADHVLRIRATGSSPVTIEGWVDGVRMVTARDTTTKPLTSGFPGFWCGGSSDPAAARFDAWSDGGSGPAIRLAWSPSPEADVVSYNVYRSPAPGGSYALVAAGVSGTSWLDRGVVEGASYSYTVAAVDEAGSISPVSGAAAGTVPSAAPILIGWNPPTLSADGTPLLDLRGFRMYRGTSPGTSSDVTDVGLVTQYTLPALDPGVYYFRVTAYDDSGNESGFSNEISVSVP